MRSFQWLPYFSRAMAWPPSTHGLGDYCGTSEFCSPEEQDELDRRFGAGPTTEQLIEWEKQNGVVRTRPRKMTDAQLDALIRMMAET